MDNPKNFNYRKSTIYLVEHMKPPYRIAEVGTFRGGNAFRLAHLDLSELYLIDPYIGYKDFNQQKDWYNQQILDKALIEAHNITLKFMDKVTIIIQKSTEAVLLFPDNYFDYVYIDGAHKYSEVKKDVEVWYPKVRKGGFLAGHDYNSVGPEKAINQFAKLKGLKVISWCPIRTPRVPDETKDWLVIKE